MGLLLARCSDVQSTHQADHADTQGELGVFGPRAAGHRHQAHVEGTVASWHVTREHLAGLMCFSPVTKETKPCLSP